MALIRCPECNKEISDTVDTCIHCGYKLNNKKTNPNKNEIIKLVLPMILVLLLKNPILYLYYYTSKFLGLNTNSKIIGTYLYSIFHIGLMVIIFYLLYTKIIKIKDSKKITICLIVVAILTSMTIFIIPNKKESNYSTDETTEKEELTNCSNKGYFISELQGDLYNTYGAYKDVIITGCNTAHYYKEQIDVECKFKYRLDSNHEYETSSQWATYRCKE